MTVLFLGPPQSLARAYLDEAEEKLLIRQDPIDADFVRGADVRFVVSHGYRHIIQAPVLGALGRRAINLHISYLPWNRGAHPNLWSVIEGTPSGVTIHRIDAGIDTGPIYAQRAVKLEPADTLRSSYERLQEDIVELFRASWPSIRSGRLRARPQPSGGSYHSSSDLALVEHLLTSGWDTPIAALREQIAGGTAR